MSKSPGWMYIQGATDVLDGPEFRFWLELLGPDGPRKWFNGYRYTHYPHKPQLREKGAELILNGWRPERPFITPSTRVVAFGSCFAGNFAEWLAENGYNQDFTQSCRALLRNPFENAAVIAQLFRWAFDEIDPSVLMWIGKDRERIFATEERRLGVRQALLEADVFVTTFSMSEIWYDKASGEPLWRVMTTEYHDPERHDFKVLSFQETIEALETIERIRAKWLPNMRMIYTVSPLPMASTFRPVSAVTANHASKAIVRAAIDEFLRIHSDLLNRVYYYFPSYEFVHTLFGDVFQSDNRHLYNYAVKAVLEAFASIYTTGRAGIDFAETPDWKKAVASDGAVAELEERDDYLTKAYLEHSGRIKGLEEQVEKAIVEIKRLENQTLWANLGMWLRSLRRRSQPWRRGVQALFLRSTG